METDLARECLKGYLDIAGLIAIALRHANVNLLAMPHGMATMASFLAELKIREGILWYEIRAIVRYA